MKGTEHAQLPYRTQCRALNLDRSCAYFTGKPMTDQSLPHRKIIRLPEYTYRDPGAYFVTVCCQKSALLFGEIIDNTMQLNDLGKIAHNEWHRLRNRWQGVAIDEVCVVMPNYMHGIVTYGDVPRPSRIPELSNVIARYKADVTRSARKYIRDFKMQIWQARFNDRVVRDENELSRIRQYILTRRSRNQKGISAVGAEHVLKKCGLPSCLC